MKKLIAPYELSRTELEILKELTQSSFSISDLARKIGKSPSSAMEAVARLQARGFVDFERRGNKKIVRLSEAKHAQLIRELFLMYPHISWKDVLSFSGIIPLLELGKITPEIVSRTTHWRALRNMMAHGIITKSDNQIKVNPRFRKVEEFIREFLNFNNSKLASQVSRAAAIVWSRGSQFIMRVPVGTKVSDPCFRPTATTTLPQYGIPLISDVEHYFFSPSPRTLEPEEVIIHLLLVDGITNTIYALILLTKTHIDRDSLLGTAEVYGFRPRVEAMLRFLETRKAQTGIILPKWEEFAEKAREYGVSV